MTCIPLWGVLLGFGFMAIYMVLLSIRGDRYKELADIREDNS